MGNPKTIDQLDAVGTITGTDQLILRDPEEASNARTKKATVDQMAAYVAANVSNITIAQVAGLQTALNDKQPLDSDLTAVAGLSSTGLIARTASGTASVRTLTAPAAGITITNGDGVSGNPTLVLANDLAAYEGLSTTGLVVRTADGSATTRTLTAPAAGMTVTNGDGVSGAPTLVLANDLAALEGLSSTGFAARTTTDTWAQRSLADASAGLTWTNPAGIAGNPTPVFANDLGALEALSSTGFAARTTTDTWAQRTLTAPAAGLTISNPAGIAGDPTFALANDLAAYEGLATSGLVVRTGDGTATTRTLTGTSAEITVTNGDGVSAAPTLSLPAALTFTGKTVTGGTFTGVTFTAADNVWTLQDNGDATKQLQFQLSGITTSTTRTLTIPDASTTIVGTDATQTLTNKTLTAPVIATIVNSGTLTLPTSTDTLVGRATSDTLTSKTLTSPTINGGTATALTGLGLRSTGSGAFDLTLANTENLTAGRTLTLKVNDVARTIDLSGNLTLAGAASLPVIAQGDLWYGSATGVISALAKNASATRYLSNTGSSNNPAWAQIDLSNGVTGDLPFANIAQIATSRIVGRTTAATGDIEALTGAQAGGLIALDDLSNIDAPTPSDGYVLTWNNSSGHWEAAAAPGAGGAGAPTDASYVTLGTNATLTAERVLTAGTGLSLTDGGAGSTITVAISDAELLAVAGLTSAADRLPYFTGSGTAALATFTSAGRALVDDADAAAQRITLAVDGKKSIPIAAAAMFARTTNGPAAGTTEMATNKNMFKTFDFDASTIEYVQFQFRMPEQWNEGTVTFLPIWSHAATATNFKASWGLQGIAISDNEAGDVAFGTAQYSNDTGGTTNNIYHGPESSAITIAGSPAAGDYVMFQVLRKADDGTNDTLAIDGRLHGIILYITTDASVDG